ncbi:site-specific integrase [Limnoglobus roseus]|uniref:Site-specific integrase n=1 Tax=Limnoglobus roseus TaxID=2598579 RepID=A0A5C1AP35_9BACT|nr:tyrosine-type recombinase/integrase [Limnoglobus roseus]QEL19512.1 site-specific integrase [Limnoglobus roseus]
MARRVPAYRSHQSGQARVTIPQPDGTRHTVYLGPFGSAESKARYAQIIAALSRGEPPPAAKAPAAASSVGRSVNEVILAYWQHAEVYYAGPGGKPTAELNHIKTALRFVRVLYGDSAAADFGPVKLAVVRAAMVERGWCRPLVNRRVDRVRRCFKWAVSQELVPGDRYEALRALPGLRRGKTAAPEPDPVGPADPGAVAATLPHLSRVVRGMAEAQRWAGMRPQDVCNLRPIDLDRSGPVWVYTPPAHKTAHRGQRRVIHLGPKAQAVLAPFLATCADPSAYLFTPAAAVAEFHAGRGAARKTPRWPSHLDRNRSKRKADPKAAPGGHFSTGNYSRAIAAGIAKANERRAKMAAGGEFDPVPAWAPNQLRHLRGTEVRKAFGLEAAQVLLGHARADVTQVYAERDFALAAKVAAETG